MTSSPSQLSPDQMQRSAFMGPMTIGFENRDLFFGRNTQARVCASMIMAEPLSIITGASGTGKSSLLQAQIIPILFGQDWQPIYAHPLDHPTTSLKEALIAQGVPSPEEEERVLEAIRSAAGAELSDRSRLSDVKAWFDRLRRGDAIRTRLLAPPPDAKTPHVGLLARYLAGLIAAEQVGDQLARVAAVDRNANHDDPVLDMVGALLFSAHRTRPRIVAGLAKKDLYGSIAAFWSEWAEPLGVCGVVLLLDQAEELYTAFGAQTTHSLTSGGDLRPSKFPWRAREDLFDKELPPLLAAAETMPFRICFSLRPEKYADLRQSLGRRAPEERPTVYFLRRFERAEAAKAIRGPIEHLNGDIAETTVATALAALAPEGDRDEIDPFLLAVTFELAWAFAAEAGHAGSIISDDIEKVRRGPDAAALQPDEQSLAQGALRWLLRRSFVRQPDEAVVEEQPGNGDEHDMLRLLKGLFSEEGARRAAAKDRLISLPLRDGDRLKALLDRLERAKLVRYFDRDRTQFVDIRHERLRDPIDERLDHLRSNEPAHGPGSGRSLLNKALEHVASPASLSGDELDQEIQDGLRNDPLPRWVSDILRWNFGSVAWDPAAARAMLASLLHLGPERTKAADTEALAEKDAASDVDTKRWREQVATLMPLAGQILAGKSALPPASTSRDEIISQILRGARFDPETVSGWLAKGPLTADPDLQRRLLIRLVVNRIAGAGDAPPNDGR